MPVAFLAQRCGADLVRAASDAAFKRSAPQADLRGTVQFKKHLAGVLVADAPELKEYQQFMIDFVNAVRDAHKAGKTADDAAASIDLTSKYPGYAKERYRAAIQAIYDELKQ